MIFDLRHGPWQTALVDAESVDALIVDAPYSDRVHDGNDGLEVSGSLGYSAMTPALVDQHVDHWAPKTRGWFVSITCHVLAPIWSAALERHGRYVFAPVPIVDQGMTVRQAGDGPASWACYLIAARPRSKAWLGGWACPGAYVRRAGDERSKRRGGKPLGVMRAIVRDYSRPGNLVLDTHAGEATTGLAAILEGRRFVGAEVWQAAQDRARPHIQRCEAMIGIQAGRTLDLFG
jgi:site-specific DNA-methyltransferase (adenine-specific)